RSCELGKLCAHLAVGGVDFNLVARFRIFQCNNPDIRQYAFAFVLNPDRNQIMPPGRDRERTRKILRLKVGDKKDDRTTGHDLVEGLQVSRREGAAPDWSREEHV